MTSKKRVHSVGVGGEEDEVVEHVWIDPGLDAVADREVEGDQPVGRPGDFLAPALSFGVHHRHEGDVLAQDFRGVLAAGDGVQADVDEEDDGEEEEGEKEQAAAQQGADQEDGEDHGAGLEQEELLGVAGEVAAFLPGRRRARRRSGILLCLALLLAPVLGKDDAAGDAGQALILGMAALGTDDALRLDRFRFRLWRGGRRRGGWGRHRVDADQRPVLLQRFLIAPGLGEGEPRLEDRRSAEEKPLDGGPLEVAEALQVVLDLLGLEAVGKLTSEDELVALFGHGVPPGKSNRATQPRRRGARAKTVPALRLRHLTTKNAARQRGAEPGGVRLSPHLDVLTSSAHAGNSRVNQ